MHNNALSPNARKPNGLLHLSRLSAGALSFASVWAASALALPWAHCVSIWILSLLLWACVEVRAGESVESAAAPSTSDSLLFAATAALFALSFFVMAWHAQPMIWLNQGLAWDGRNYFGMYGAFKGYPHAEIPAPYGQRVGLPMLATFLHFHAEVNFGVFEGAFWVGAAALLAHSLRAQFRLSAPATLAVFAWAHLMFISPARAAHFAPFTVEAPATFFVVLFVWLSRTRSLTPAGTLFLCAFAGFAAALFKETALLIAGLGLASHWAFALSAALARRRASTAGWLRKALGAAAEALCARSVLPWMGLSIGAAAGLAAAQIPFGFWSGAANAAILGFWLAKRVEQPTDLLRVAAAYAMALAPFAILLVAHGVESARSRFVGGRSARADAAGDPLPERDEAPTIGAGALWLLLGLYVAVSACSGRDLTRFAFFALPLAAPLAGRALSACRAWPLVVLCGLSLPLARVFSTIPQPGFADDPLKALNEGRDLHGLYAWFAEYAPLRQALLVIAYVVACGLLVAVARATQRAWDARRARAGALPKDPAAKR